ncbi:TPA: S41 family peptidase [Elizabethkingia meningoseptica]
MKINALFICLFSVLSFAQEKQEKCNCEQNFQWVKKTFEENDAGFQYALEQKGKDAYQANNERILIKVKKAKTLNECTPVLYEWLTFFRSGHINIRTNENMQTQPPGIPSIITNPDQETVKIKRKEFDQYLTTIKEPSYEGIWKTGPYVIGIKKTGNNYVGFILEQEGTGWREGQVKLKINTDKTGDKGVLFVRDFTKQENLPVKMIGKNHLSIGQFSFVRNASPFKDSEEINNYIEAISATKPYFKKISETTTYIRIPSFGEQYKKAIDSIISANSSLIENTPNFIIDIRDNGGGSDMSFSKLLPLLYTNPIRTVGVLYYSTPLNNKRMLDLAEDKNFSELSQTYFKKAYATLNTQLGKFVQLDESGIEVDQYSTVLKYPQKIAILINKGNGSTAEQFLLAAKQSTKVKLMGTTTAGVLDISNMYYVDAPCKEFKLGYSLSKSLRIPNMAIDGKGIQPDYYLDSEIPDEKWIKFAEETLDHK